MSRVITFSRYFPKGHPKHGERTLFPAKIIEGLLMLGTYEISDDQLDTCWLDGDYTKHEAGCKWHTIRSGNRWKVGDKFSPRVWSGKPYQSKMITIAPDIEVKKVWDFQMVTENDDGENDWSYIKFLDKFYTYYGYGGYDDKKIVEIAKNDGFDDINDFYQWFDPERSVKQKLSGDSKIFSGQIICWNENIEY